MKYYFNKNTFGFSITNDDIENQIEIEIDVNNPPNYTLSENGKFKGFYSKSQMIYDEKKKKPRLLTEKELIEKNNKILKVSLKSEIVKLQQEITSGELNDIDMSDEKLKLNEKLKEYKEV